MAITRGTNFISMSEVGDHLDQRMIVKTIVNSGTANGQLTIETSPTSRAIDYTTDIVDVHVLANDPFVLDAKCLDLNGIRIAAKLSDPVFFYY